LPGGSAGNRSRHAGYLRPGQSGRRRPRKIGTVLEAVEEIVKKRDVFVALAALVLSSCAGMAKEIPYESRLIVAVAGVESALPSSGSWDDALVAELLKTKRLRVIERSRLDALLKENELSLSELSDAAARPKMLSVLGADGILFVNVTDIREYSGKTTDAVTGWWSDVSLGIEAKVAARLVSVSTGEVLAASAASGKAEAGKFSGAMGIETVDKGKDELTAEAVSKAIVSLARAIARAVPEKQ